jgi:hypothetical protein
MFISLMSLDHPPAAKAGADLAAFSGTSKLVPFQNGRLERLFQQAVNPCPFKADALSNNL